MSYKKVDAAGNIFWYNGEGELHREGEPAVDYKSGDKLWYINDRLHREDGPAIELSKGYKAWYVNDIRYSEQEYLAKMRLEKLQKIL